jgi:hypothetical protein
MAAAIKSFHMAITPILSTMGGCTSGTETIATTTACCRFKPIRKPKTCRIQNRIRIRQFFPLIDRSLYFSVNGDGAAVKSLSDQMNGRPNIAKKGLFTGREKPLVEFRWRPAAHHDKSVWQYVLTNLYVSGWFQIHAE